MREMDPVENYIYPDLTCTLWDCHRPIIDGIPYCSAHHQASAAQESGRIVPVFLSNLHSERELFQRKIPQIFQCLSQQGPGALVPNPNPGIPLLHGNLHILSHPPSELPCKFLICFSLIAITSKLLSHVSSCLLYFSGYFDTEALDERMEWGNWIFVGRRVPSAAAWTGSRYRYKWGPIVRRVYRVRTPEQLLRRRWKLHHYVLPHRDDQALYVLRYRKDPPEHPPALGIDPFFAALQQQQQQHDHQHQNHHHQHQNHHQQQQNHQQQHHGGFGGHHQYGFGEEQQEDGLWEHQGGYQQAVHTPHMTKEPPPALFKEKVERDKPEKGGIADSVMNSFINQVLQTKLDELVRGNQSSHLQEAGKVSDKSNS
uniref:Uncharacterized protein n=1 Tax=Noccaea caerulescens TaxID=107243 RepID=A0A1J3HL01_NOCCA